MTVNIGVRHIRAAAVALAAVGTLTGTTAADAVTGPPATPDTRCLWADTTHARGEVVAAGGRTFTCGTAPEGAPHWYRGATTNTPSTVPNPGATAAPAGHFSPGARQPGTEYTDYCVGDQLIEGRDDVYEAVTTDTGLQYWHIATPADTWTFDPGTHPAPHSQRSSSMCRDGQLL